MVKIDFSTPFIKNTPTEFRVKQGIRELSDTVHTPSYDESFKREIAYFIECVEGEADAHTTFAEAHEDLRVIIDLFRTYQGERPEPTGRASDRGGGYNWSFGLRARESKRQTIGKRSLVESQVGILGYRTVLFSHRLSDDSTRDSAESWLTAFDVLYKRSFKLNTLLKYITTFMCHRND